MKYISIRILFLFALFTLSILLAQNTSAQQTCSDGTPNNQCSQKTNPLYCFNNTFIEDCNKCGCDPGKICQVDGTCQTTIPSIQNCSDGTPYGQCSQKSTYYYCDNGNLIPKCSVCGCPSNRKCEADDQCYSIQTNTCSDGTLQGQCSTNKPFYCFNSQLITDCNKCDCKSGEMCQADGSCKQAAVQPKNCSDGTPNNQCSMIKPFYCSNSQLLEDCNKCRCSVGRVCLPDGTCQLTFVPLNQTLYNCNKNSIVGDIDGDGNITQKDYDIIKDMILKNIPLPSDPCCVDTNGDNAIDIADPEMINNVLGGSVSSLGTCQTRQIQYKKYDCNKNSLKGDIDNDGSVTQKDWEIIRDIFLDKIPQPSNSCCADVNSDNAINIGDLSAINNFLTGKTPLGTCAGGKGLFCSDRTPFDQCSAKKPYYCHLGNLIQECNFCGCNPNETCQTDGSCQSSTNVDTTSPDIYKLDTSPNSGPTGTVFTISANVNDLKAGNSGINSVVVDISDSSWNSIASVNLFDDGVHNDGSASDDVYANVWDSTGQPEDFYTVNISAEDGAGNKQNQFTYFLVSSPQCLEAIPNHNNPNANRINLVFIGVNHNLTDFVSYVNLAIDETGTNNGILSVEPFKSNKDKFNFWYVNQIGLVSQYKEGWTERGIEAAPIVDALTGACVYSNKIKTVLINWNFRSSANFGESAYNSYITGDLQVLRTNNRVVVHELGHAVLQLPDEYIEKPQILPQGAQPKQYNWSHAYMPTPPINCPLITIPPNKPGGGVITFYNCTASQQSYDDCINNSQWNYYVGNGCGREGIVDCGVNYPNNELEISCHAGAGFQWTGGYLDLFRPSKNTIMRNHNEDPFSFGPWNEMWACQEIDRLTGSAGGVCSNHCLKGCSQGQKCIGGMCV